MHSYLRVDLLQKRFGRPQFLAGLLLLAFLGQALWLVTRELHANGALESRENESRENASRGNESEAARLAAGWEQWHGEGIAGAPYRDLQGEDFADISADGFDTEQSPLLSLLSTTPLLVWPGHSREPLLDFAASNYWRWLPRLPFLAVGVFLGASLWYVARRLCGNTGGLIALTLYCFSPSLIQSSAVWHTEPEIVAAWGAFGTIFTAIAVAHTLYAPREVVLWNWRRIVLLGVSLAIAVGSQFSMIVLMPMALAFLLYVAPVRRGAGLAIWLAACIVASLLMFALYFFHAHVFAESLRHASFWGATWRGFAVLGVYRQVAIRIARASPVLLLALPVAIGSYALWPRTRYFGNTAPLLVAVAFLLLGMAHPHVAGAGFLLSAMPFLFVFVAGVFADLLETRYRPLVSACMLGMMAAYIAWSLISLTQVPRG